jgi:MFS superfamily sulfate permease-like transporter
MAAGLIGSFAVDASPPNSAIVAESGARSQLTNTMAAIVVLIVVLVATAPLANLPQATLGATLLFVATRLFRVNELHNILRFDRVEFGLAIATLLVVALVGIQQGVIIAIVLSLADRTRRTARPEDTLLGREPGTDHWIPRDVGKATEEVPGVLVYQVYAPLWYGNADYLRLRIRNLVDSAPTPIHAVIFDAAGIPDIDYTGLQALRDLASELTRRGVMLRVARASHLVHHNLKHGALLGQLGADHLDNSVEEAVIAAQRHP